MRWPNRRKRNMPRPKQVAVKVRLPFLGEIAGTWEPIQAERRAAWELYIELITRVTIVELRPGEGSVREALTSMYSVFGSTREILRKYGPEVAPRGAADAVTFGGLSVGVLNGALRPLLAKWHPALLAWEAQRPETVDPIRHERNWDQLPDLSRELATTRLALTDVAKVLADVAGAAYLLPPVPDPTPNSRGGGLLLSGDLGQRQPPAVLCRLHSGTKPFVPLDGAIMAASPAVDIASASADVRVARLGCSLRSVPCRRGPDRGCDAGSRPLSPRPSTRPARSAHPGRIRRAGRGRRSWPVGGCVRPASLPHTSRAPRHARYRVHRVDLGPGGDISGNWSMPWPAGSGRLCRAEVPSASAWA